jgi:hypothetical protein
MNEIVKPLREQELQCEGASVRVEIWGHPERSLVIATEILESSVTSMSSVVTAIAAEVVSGFKLDWLGLTWIAHYTEQSVVHQETFYLVEMKWTGIGFTEPVAHEISPFEVEKLIQGRGQILML